MRVEKCPVLDCETDRMSWLSNCPAWLNARKFDLAGEQDFQSQYRRAALSGVLYATFSASLIFLAFAAVALLSESYSSIAMGVRMILIVILMSVALVVIYRPDAAEKNYVILAGSGSAAALVGTVFLLTLGPHGAPSAGMGGSPALIFGLFLHYALLRLPLWCAAGIGWAVSVACILWAVPLVVGGNAEVRSILYFLFANAAGMAACRSIESRERELFYQRRRAESAQRQLRERAIAAEEAHRGKSRLIAAVSHDLRQPMMATTAYLGVLKSRLDHQDLPQATKQLDNLAASISLLNSTLDHLLTAASFDAGAEPVRLEAVELAPVLEELQRTFAADATRRGIEVRVRIPGRRIVLTTDRMALQRVLMNLVANAVKFTEANGRRGRGVVVRATMRGRACRIDVADTGIGIPAGHLKSIWEPYFQVANAQRDRSKGLGLGLFLVRRALDMLPDHAVALRSRPGRGSRFTVTVPAWLLNDSGALVKAAPRVQGDEADLLEGAYVLLIEDDTEARQAILALLDDWGVVHASGATLQELLVELEADGRDPDALITDFRLPGETNGADCVRLLRERLGAPLPGVIVTGDPDLAAIQRFLPDDTVLLQKPFDPSALRVPLADAIRRARRAESV